MSLYRRVRPTAVIALAIAIVGPVVQVDAAGSADPPNCHVAGNMTLRGDGWIQIKGPDYSDDEGASVITSFAVSSREQGFVLATNSKTVKASDNGGCTWSRVAGGENALDSTPIDVDYGQQARPDVFTHVAMSDSKGAWLASYDDAGGVPHPHAYMSEDARPTGSGPTKPFVSYDTGLPNVGRPLALVATPRDRTVAYMLIEEPPDARSGDTQTWVRRLYGTVTDTRDPSVFGTRWGLVTLPEGFDRIEDIALSPAGTRTVWLWSGANWAVAPDALPDVPDPRPDDPTAPKPPTVPNPTWLTGSLGSRITTIDITDRNLARVYTESGRVHTANGAVVPGQGLSLPGVGTSASNGSRTNVTAFSGPKGTFGYDISKGKWVDVSPAGRPVLQQVRIAPSDRNVKGLWGRTDRFLFLRRMHEGELFIAPPVIQYIKGLDPNVIPKLPKSTLKNARLTPDTQVVTVEPGKVAKADIRFETPADPTPLDVFFLVDTTTSMQTAINGLRQGMKDIATRLFKVGIDVQFGVGEFKDITAVAPNPTDPRPQDPPRVYQLRQRITGDLPALMSALDKLKEAGGGDDPEAQTVGLEQSVLGTGMQPYADPGGQAGFRPKAFKVIVLVTDAEFHEEQQYPSKAKTIATLNAYDVSVVGVVVLTSNDQDRAMEDVEEIVAGTETYAPPAGIDCDTDGSLDVGPNRPLVCQAANSAPNIAPAIVGLLLGVKDPGLVGVEFAGDTSVIKKLSRPNLEMMNLKLENTLKFSADLTCRKDQDGTDIPLTLVGTIRSKVADLGGITVQCRGIPEPPPPPEIPPPPKIIRPVIVPPPPPPPALIFQGQPPQNPPPNANPNAGFAQQEEQQFQLAAVTQGESEQQEQEEEAPEFAMSGLRETDVAAAPMLMGAAALSMFAAGLAVTHRRRTQHQVSRAYARTRRR